jgi:hypothetical protein
MFVIGAISKLLVTFVLHRSTPPLEDPRFIPDCTYSAVVLQGILLILLGTMAEELFCRAYLLLLFQASCHNRRLCAKAFLWSFHNRLSQVGGRTRAGQTQERTSLLETSRNACRTLGGRAHVVSWLLPSSVGFGNVFNRFLGCKRHQLTN